MDDFFVGQIRDEPDGACRDEIEVTAATAGEVETVELAERDAAGLGNGEVTGDVGALGRSEFVDVALVKGEAGFGVDGEPGRAVLEAAVFVQRAASPPASGSA